MPAIRTLTLFCVVFRLAGFCFVCIASSSCVPLLVGGVVGYVANEKGVGEVAPLGSSGSQSYEPPAAYGESGSYDSGGYDEPVY